MADSRAHALPRFLNEGYYPKDEGGISGLKLRALRPITEDESMEEPSMSRPATPSRRQSIGDMAKKESHDAAPRALLIDDDEPLLNAYARVLERSGYRVDTAGDAESGLAALARTAFDVVLSDIRMPGTSGIELVERMRANGLDVPVVLVTGAPHVDTAARAVELGVVRYLAKPVDLTQLARSVGEAVRQHGLARARRLALDNEALQSLVDELRRSKAAAEAGARAKAAFLSKMKHELRTPMTAVLGMTELVLESELTRDQRTQLEAVKSAGEALMELIADLLDVAALDHGEVALEPKAFAVRDTIQQVLVGFAGAAEPKGIALVAEVAPEVPDVLVGDPARFQQVLKSVLGNAVKFGRAGEVRLCAALQADSGDRACLHVTVRDPGVGIPPERIPHVLEPFVQGDDSSTRRYGGAGLGLRIASQLVALMDGTLEVESTPDVGTEIAFTAWFERLRPAHPGSLAGDARDASPTNPAEPPAGPGSAATTAS
jgi:signal transduction histidine kinase